MTGRHSFLYCFPLPRNLQSAEIASFIVVVMDSVQHDTLGLHAVVVNFRFPFLSLSPEEMEGEGAKCVFVLSYIVPLFDLSYSLIVMFSVPVPMVTRHGFFLVGLRNMMEIYSTLLWLYVTIIILCVFSERFPLNYTSGSLITNKDKTELLCKHVRNFVQYRYTAYIQNNR